MVESIDAMKFKEVAEKENCLVVLGSAWCKDCIRIEPFLKDLSEEYAHLIKIYKIDSKKEEELSSTLNIRAIPTLIFYRNGVEVGKRVPGNGHSLVQMIAVVESSGQNRNL